MHYFYLSIIILAIGVSMVVSTLVKTSFKYCKLSIIDKTILIVGTLCLIIGIL